MARAEFSFGGTRLALPRGRPAGLKFLLEVLGRGIYAPFSTAEASLLFDVGANVGGLSLQRCLARPALRAVAIEPRAATFEDLRRNVELNGLAERVTTVRAVASDAVGTRLLGLPRRSTMGIVREPGAIDASGPALEVEATTLDALAELHGVPDAIKIDVEGHEIAVLRGAARCLSEARQVVLEAHTPDRRDACARLLTEHGLRVRDAYPLLFAER